jgi:hypothetical protein
VLFPPLLCGSLPIAAVVDSKIYCAHGGIPRPRRVAAPDGSVVFDVRASMEVVRTLPVPLPLKADANTEHGATALQVWNWVLCVCCVFPHLRGGRAGSFSVMPWLHLWCTGAADAMAGSMSSSAVDVGWCGGVDDWSACGLTVTLVCRGAAMCAR